MKRNLIKLSSLCIAGVMLFSSVLSTSAYSVDENGNSIEEITYQNSDDEDFIPSTSVFAELGSSYKVTIPKVIVLSGITKKANYFVKVEGDIAAYETIYVVPEETVDLYSNNKAVQEGIINQDKTAWTYSTLSDNANGAIVANGLTAGNWTGTFWFNINFNKVLGDIIDPDHIHDENTLTVTRQENVIEPTCTTAGSCEEVVYCAGCNEEFSRVAKRIEPLEHTGYSEESPVCERCGESVIVAHFHNEGNLCFASTETKSAQQVYNEYKASHNYGETASSAGGCYENDTAPIQCSYTWRTEKRTKWCSDCDRDTTWNYHYHVHASCGAGKTFVDAQCSNHDLYVNRGWCTNGSHTVNVVSNVAKCGYTNGQIINN